MYLAKLQRHPDAIAQPSCGQSGAAAQDISLSPASRAAARSLLAGRRWTVVAALIHWFGGGGELVPVSASGAAHSKYYVCIVGSP